MNDQLRPDERIRLEALNQAVQSKLSFGGSSEDILQRARKFENYIRNGAESA